jgi:glycine C-acetyltransferase
VPIIPVICPDELQAIALARACQDDGLFVQPAVHPAVPRETPRLRIIVTLHHRPEDLERIVTVVAANARSLGLIP